MKYSIGWIVLLLVCSSVGYGNPEQTAANDFFSKEAQIHLKTASLSVEGEVVTTGPVNCGDLPLRSVTVRQAHWDSYGKRFTGAYRYVGYSLFDILKDRRLNKVNKKEFPPPTDLMLEIRDKQGAAVLVSWGEIFYARNPHRILIATRVSPIVPSKTRRVPPTPEKSLLVCGDDLFSLRNLIQPRRIIVRSAAVKLPIQRHRPYVSSRSIRILRKEMLLDEVKTFDGINGRDTSPCVFFGRGRGFHGFHNFSGRKLSSVLERYFNLTPEFIATGFLIMSSVDGYRAVFSAAEIFNRGDGNEFILLDSGLCEKKGRWAVYPGPDFFSDRAVSGIEAIRINDLEPTS